MIKREYILCTGRQQFYANQIARSVEGDKVIFRMNSSMVACIPIEDINFKFVSKYPNCPIEIFLNININPIY